MISSIGWSVQSRKIQLFCGRLMATEVNPHLDSQPLASQSKRQMRPPRQLLESNFFAASAGSISDQRMSVDDTIHRRVCERRGFLLLLLLQYSLWKSC